jgi:hypothetical protein
MIHGGEELENTFSYSWSSSVRCWWHLSSFSLFKLVVLDCLSLSLSLPFDVCSGLAVLTSF